MQHLAFISVASQIAACSSGPLSFSSEIWQRGENIADQDEGTIRHKEPKAGSAADPEFRAAEAAERIESGITPKGLVLFWYAAVFIFALPVGIAFSVYVRTVDYKRISNIHELPSIANTSQPALRRLAKHKTRQQLDFHSYRANLVRGSHMLTNVAVVVSILTLVRVMASSECKSFGSLMTFMLMFLSFALVGYTSWLCARYPLDILFWPVISYWFALLPALSLPPFHWSCTDLAGQCWDEALATHGYLRAALFHNDCSLAGPSAIATLMTWILVLPWIIPRCNMFFIVWVWLLVVLPLWAVAWREITEEDIIPMAHMRERYLVLIGSLVISHYKSYYFERQQFHDAVAKVVEEEGVRGMFQILHHMVPLHVIPELLTNPDQTIAQMIDRVTILFVVIADFDKKTETMTPTQLLNYLNGVFEKLDDACEENRVTKIETVGEEYVCCVGVLPEEEEEFRYHGHAGILEKMIRAASDIMALQSRDLKFKMGMHTGPIVAGIVGKKLPRYRLVGDTINTAARMMQKGPLGMLQFGMETHSALPPDLRGVSPRGEIEMKGKGLVQTFLYNGTPLPRRNDEVSHVTEETMSNVRKSSRFSSVFFNQAGSRAVARPRMDSTSTGDLMDDLDALRSGGDCSDFWKQVASRLHRGPKFVRRRAAAQEAESGVPRDPGELELSTVTLTHVPSSTPSHSNRHDSWVEEEEVFRQVKADIADKKNESRMWLTPGRHGFTAEMDLAWESERHKASCDKLGKQNGVLAISIIAVTVTEINFMIAHKLYRSVHTLFGKSRLPVVVHGRMLCLVILILTWMAVSTEPVKKNPRFARLFLAGTCAMTVIMFLTYDAMLTTGTFDQDFDGCFLVNESINAWLYDSAHEKCISNNLMRQNFLAEERAKYAKFVGFSASGHRPSELENIDCEVREVLENSINTDDNNFSLRFILAYYFIVKQADLLYAESWLFVLVAIVMLFMSGIHHCGVYFYTMPCRLLFIMNAVNNAMVAYVEEKHSREQFKFMHVQEKTSRQVEHILDTLLPPKVVQEMAGHSIHGSPSTPTHLYRHATISQSDLCGFTKLAATKQPKEVVRLIGDLFRYFDELCDKYYVYKVETVGDAYIAGVAESTIIAEARHNSPVNVILFSLSMVKEVKRWSSENGFSVNCRVGVHYGECIGGVVGTRSMAYHVFGDINRVIEILESTSREGEVQVSRACKLECERYLSEIERPLPVGDFAGFTERTEPQLSTSKGEVHSYDAIGGRTFLVTRTGIDALDAPVMLGSDPGPMQPNGRMTPGGGRTPPAVLPAGHLRASLIRRSIVAGRSSSESAQSK